MSTVDRLGRPLGNLRLSVTDRCNLRCAYCMPEQNYTWLPTGDILTFEEISALVDVFAGLGVRRLRLTGGEPLFRRDLPELVSLLAAKKGLEDLALTTNGVLLADQAKALKQAGLHRITVSLDTLRPERFRALTRRSALPQVLDGIHAAVAEGLSGLKLDTVVIRGTNEDELLELLQFARRVSAELRFIEYMDVGGATHWTPEKVVGRPEILSILSERLGPITPIVETSSAPAERFRCEDGTIFGIIASTTAPFCRSCDRSRLTADGHWFRCLYAREGLDLKGPLRDGASTEELAKLLVSTWASREDRGAEERLQMRERGALFDAGQLKNDPHLEMHTRGG